MDILPFDPKHGKTQGVRLLDVIVIGPVMVYGGLRLSDHDPWLGPVLSLFGIATIVYNGRNYLLKREDS